MNYFEKRGAIIRMQNKICALANAADPDSELALALCHAEQKNPCDQIVGELLTQRVRRAQQAAKNAASAASGKHAAGAAEKYNMHKLTWDLIASICHLLDEADIPVAFADEAKFVAIYNIAQHAAAFADIALKASALAHRESIDDSIDDDINIDDSLFD
jgi:hypothetical protein